MAYARYEGFVRGGMVGCTTAVWARLAAWLVVVGVASVPVHAEEEAGFRQLFDGTSLAGWRANENQDSWKVVDGRIVCRYGSGANKKGPPRTGGPHNSGRVAEIRSGT